MRYLIIFFFTFSLYGKISYSFKEYVGEKEYPEISFSSDKKIKSLVVIVKKDGKKYLTKRFKNLKPQNQKVIRFKQRMGEHNYSISFKGIHFDKKLKDITDNLNMKGVRLKSLLLDFKKENVDIKNANIKFNANRGIEKVEIKIYNTQKKVIYENKIDYDTPQKKDISISWTKSSDEVLSIQITAYDKYGFWSGMEINPFSVMIPHEEIVFSSGKWNVEKNELPKIKNSYSHVKKALRKYGKALELRLYIAGYTDTVGDPKSNLILSENRAKAIARSFRKQGLKISIYYQGFGEEVLRVKTSDEVNNEANRRAIYILTNHEPEISNVIPRDRWKRLK